MEAEIVKIKRSWRIGYISLPAKHQGAIREKIMEELNWDYHMMRFRMVARVYMYKAEVDKLREIFAEYNIDPFTGKALQPEMDVS